MSLGNAAENDVLLLLANNTNWANVGDAVGLRGSTAAGNFYAESHTASPGETGNQTTSEATYTGYARSAQARSAAAWTVSGTAPTQFANVSAISQGACTALSNTLTDFSLGRDAAGAGELLWYGALTASLAVSAGITPSFAPGAFVCTID